MRQIGTVLDDKVVGIWYLQTTPTQDWMATVREVVPEQKYELTYRFRYYEDEKAFDSKDKKNWYRAEVTGTRNYVTLALRKTAETMAIFAIGPVYEYLNDGDFSLFIKRFQDAPFVYMRQASREEFEKTGEETK